MAKLKLFSVNDIASEYEIKPRHIEELVRMEVVKGYYLDDRRKIYVSEEDAEKAYRLIKTVESQSHNEVTQVMDAETRKFQQEHEGIDYSTALEILLRSRPHLKNLYYSSLILRGK